MKKERFLEAAVYLVSKWIEEADMSDLYDELDIYNVYMSGLFSASLERNFDLLVDYDCKWEDLESLLSEDEMSRYEDDDLWNDFFELLWEKHRDYRDELYSAFFNGKKNYEWVEENVFVVMCKIKGVEYKKSRGDYGDPLVDWSLVEKPVSFNDFMTKIDEYNDCNENEIDTWEWLYSSEDFLPTKKYMVMALYRLYENGLDDEELLGFKRDEQLRELLDLVD